MIVGRTSDVNVAAELAKSHRSQAMYAMRAWWDEGADYYRPRFRKESQRLALRKGILESLYWAVTKKLSQSMAEEAPPDSDGALNLADRASAAQSWDEANMRIRRATMRGSDFKFNEDGYAAGMAANPNPSTLGQPQPAGALT